MITNFQDKFLETLAHNHAHQPEFQQAVKSFYKYLQPFLQKNPHYLEHNILERIIEPERIISFKVPWLDDAGKMQVNRGYRVQFNSAIGPYKGGLRFHPSVNESILKFLGFKQTFKNSVTGLPMGGGKGGSNFDPKGKSDNEVMKFCQSFINELYRHIGANIDVPAGDIGVGGREVGFMFGQYKRLTGSFEGVFTGKGYEFGGSLIRPEATGYGLVYFAEEMLKTRNDSFEGKSVAVSGSGNVAQYTTEKIIDLGGKVVTLSDSGGTIYDPKGIDSEKLAYVMDLKNVQRGRIKEYVNEFDAEYFEGARPWTVASFDIALPCATQNELNEAEAKTLVDRGTVLVAEGANMPSTPEAVQVFTQAKILYGPGIACNAGGVATSGLEMSQNSLRMSWSHEEVDSKLRGIMQGIHNLAATYGTDGNGYINYVQGANIAGFIKVADAMIAQGM